MPLTKSEARLIALATPGAAQRPYFGKPSIFVGEDYLCRIHDKEEAVVLRTGSMEMREVMLEAEPDLFYFTEHYRNFPTVLARLKALDRKTLRDLLAARLLRMEQRTAKKKAKKPLKKPAKKSRG